MSSEPKHTAGPWSVTGNEIRKSEGVPMLLATVNNSEGASINGYSAEANARLISRAPDMLKTLEYVSKFLASQVVGRGMAEGDSEVYAVVQSQIRKATQA